MSSGVDCRFALSVHRSSRSSAPAVHIFLQRVVRQPNGMLGVTPVCTSLAEVESEIEALRRELDGVLREARQAFQGKPGAAASA